MGKVDKSISISAERRTEIKKIVNDARSVLMKRRGVVLLDAMPQEERDYVKEIVSNLENVRRFSIVLPDGKKAVVLRYHKKIENINVDALHKKAKWSFHHKRFKVALGCYFNLLQHQGIGYDYYEKVAQCFMNLEKMEQAELYFTISDGIKRKLRLKGLEAVEVDQDTFSFEDEYYGIKCFPAINEEILKTGIDITSACAKFGLGKENTSLVILIYAREYFRQGMEKIGDKLLKAYEMSDNKTSRTKAVLEEIRRNKKFYLAKRDFSCELSLVLKLK